MLEQVSKDFGNHIVLQQVNLTLPDRGAVCFFGPSGCGKTTLTRLICGLDTPDAGRIVRSPGLRFACHFQEDRLLPWYTAEENLALALGGMDVARMWLERLGLSDASKRYPDELSGGMRRRVSLARALGFSSDVLVLDEPLRELDAATCARMQNLIAAHLGARLLLLVTHDRQQAEYFHCEMIEEPFRSFTQKEDAP